MTQPPKSASTSLLFNRSNNGFSTDKRINIFIKIKIVALVTPYLFLFNIKKKRVELYFNWFWLYLKITIIT